jgi:hypothetical protein
LGNRGLKIGQVIAATYANGVVATAGSVTIRSVYGVEDASVLTSRIVGEYVELDGGAGSIRATVDSNVLGEGGLAARAKGSITLTEVLGDMVLAAPEGWDGASVLSTGTDGSGNDVRLTVKRGAIVDGALERATANVGDSLEALKASGFSEKQLQAIGIGSKANLMERARYAMAPDLIKALLPHEELLGQGDSGGGESLNVQGRNITLLSEGLTAGVKYGVGRSSDRVTITNPSDFGSLTESHKALLAQASAADVIETQYRRYEWIGDEATVDLSAVGTFNNALLWREVGATARAPVNLPVLASSDGIADVVKGQWVENRRELLSVTLQVTDDINISASGDVAAFTAKMEELVEMERLAEVALEVLGRRQQRETRKDSVERRRLRARAIHWIRCRIRWRSGARQQRATTSPAEATRIGNTRS